MSYVRRRSRIFCVGTLIDARMMNEHESDTGRKFLQKTASPLARYLLQFQLQFNL